MERNPHTNPTYSNQPGGGMPTGMGTSGMNTGTMPTTATTMGMTGTTSGMPGATMDPAAAYGSTSVPGTSGLGMGTTAMGTGNRGGGTMPEPSTVKVNTYNGSHRSGLARTTAADLKSRGFKIGRIANDPLGQHLKGAGEIRYGVKGAVNAALLRYYVPDATLTLDQRGDDTVDLVTGEAFPGLAPQSEVDAAVASPTPTTSGTGCPSPK